MPRVAASDVSAALAFFARTAAVRLLTGVRNSGSRMGGAQLHGRLAWKIAPVDIYRGGALVLPGVSWNDGSSRRHGCGTHASNVSPGGCGNRLAVAPVIEGRWWSRPRAFKGRHLCCRMLLTHTLPRLRRGLARLWGHGSGRYEAWCGLYPFRCLQSRGVQARVDGHEIARVVVVPDKLVNIVVR